MEGPVCILRKGESGTFELNEQALRDILLNSDVQNKRVAVVSIVGAYRTGKSFLLNFFLRYLRYGGRDDWILGDQAGDVNRLEGFVWERAIEGVTQVRLFVSFQCEIQ